jgi:hypothetical protein
MLWKLYGVGYQFQRVSAPAIIMLIKVTISRIPACTFVLLGTSECFATGTAVDIGCESIFVVDLLYRGEFVIGFSHLNNVKSYGTVQEHFGTSKHLQLAHSVRCVVQHVPPSEKSSQEKKTQTPARDQQESGKKAMGRETLVLPQIQGPEPAVHPGV